MRILKPTRSMASLAAKICRYENKKHEASIGDVREVLAILSDMIFNDAGIFDLLANNGIKRSKKVHKCDE